MKNMELVFIPLPASSHQTSAIQFAKRLIDQDERLSVTFLIIIHPAQIILEPYNMSLGASDDRIRFITIPPTITDDVPQPSSPVSIEKFANLFFENHKSQVEEAVMKLLSDDSTRLLGFVLDMFSSCMIDVANKFNVPSYIYFPFNTAFLGFLLHLPMRHDQIGGVHFHSSDPDSDVPSYLLPVPSNVLPGAVFDNIGGGYEAHLYHGTRFHEAKGIIVNSFVELEPYAVNSIVAPPTVYTVGPLLDHKIHNKSTDSIKIENWLNNQPPKSVLFLCFGSMGSFSEAQLEQMAIALEKSGHRFLWSIRQPPPKDRFGATSDYTNVEKVLPHGFLTRVQEKGMVCGWVPQVKVLSHESVKGFVSHCGWNSVLESLWYGVPIATWPLNAEQHLNAFSLVRELGIAVELSLTYRSSQSELVILADQIEKAIECLMNNENPVMERVKEISEKGRKAVINGGSSFLTLEKLVDDMLQNIEEK